MVREEIDSISNFLKGARFCVGKWNNIFFLPEYIIRVHI